MTENPWDWESIQPLVVVIGTGMTMAGFSGDDAPRTVYPTIVGRVKNPGFGIGMDHREYFVGDEAQAKRGILRLSKPFPSDGTPINWDFAEKLFHYTFYNELGITPEEHPVLLSSFHSMTDRTFEKISKIMFEVFNLPGIYIADSGVLSLYSSGRTTGCTLESGDGVTRSVCVYDDLPIQYSSTRSVNNPFKKFQNGISGGIVTKYLEKLMNERDKGYEFTSSADREIVRDIKEKLCYVSYDYDMELERAGMSAHCYHNYTLPDSTIVSISEERFMCTEILFKPYILGEEFEDVLSLPETVHTSIQKCHDDLKKDLYSNIVLSGGNTMFEGIVERMSTEVQKLVDSDINNKNKCNIRQVRINAPAERKFSTWIGGSILSSLSTFEKEWVKKHEYEEKGDYRIVREKCQLACCHENEEEGYIRYLKRGILDDPDLDERILYLTLEEEGNDNDNKKKKIISLENINIEISRIHFLLNL